MKRAFLHLDVQAIGKRCTDITHTTQLGGYTEASVKLSVPLSRNLNLFATVYNLLDHCHQMLTGYPMPCINGAGGFVLYF